MFMPAVFHENLFDDFFDPFWNDTALERAMNREARSAFGKRGANMMKTDVKQTAAPMTRKIRMAATCAVRPSPAPVPAASM